MKINKELQHQSGIYSFINLQNGKRYIGSSKNIYNRLHEHLHNLSNDKGHNKHFQSSWNKHGEDQFIYNVLEFCEENDRFIREQYYIDFMKPEYNFSLNVIGNLNKVVTEDQKQQISNTLKEKYKSGEITAYKQDHAWVKCYVYDIETFELFKECKNIKSALEVVGSGRTYGKDRMEKAIINNKYYISRVKFDSFLETKNYICENLFTRISSEKEYLISEDTFGTLLYHRNITDCANIIGCNRSTINKHKDASFKNPYSPKLSQYKIYFSKIYIPYKKVPSTGEIQ